MLSYINPDEICPVEHLQAPTPIYQQHRPNLQQKYPQSVFQQDQCYQVGQAQQAHDQPIELLAIEPSYELVIDASPPSSDVGPPPVLVAKDEYKFSNIQQRLDYDRAMAHQRQEQLKIQLERDPPKISLNSKRPSGKKLTGRERQLELERIETELLKKRDRYKEMIADYESKCQKLRELLGNIVASSPEYNEKFIKYHAEGLFMDPHINGLTD